MQPVLGQPRRPVVVAERHRAVGAHHRAPPPPTGTLFARPSHRAGQPVDHALQLHAWLAVIRPASGSADTGPTSTPPHSHPHPKLMAVARCRTGVSPPGRSAARSARAGSRPRLARRAGRWPWCGWRTSTPTSTWPNLPGCRTPPHEDSWTVFHIAAISGCGFSMPSLGRRRPRRPVRWSASRHRTTVVC